LTLLALLQARNEERFLPGWLANVSEIVDGIVALDDGSDDATAEMLAAHPKTVELIRKPRSDAWDERGNQMALIKAGRRYRAAWFFCMDADERAERCFGSAVSDLIARADREGIDAYSLRLRELWGDRGHYRIDGIWGGKARYRLFRNNPEHRRFDPRPLHRSWMPLEIVATLERAALHSGYNLYHLGMISREDRAARHARYKALDPENRFQAQGYDYLIDETEVQLAAVPIDRDFVPLCDPAFG
jgi:glycosyltransferase involved in cell wall biosynthesis